MENDDNLIIGRNSVREAIRSGRDIDCVLVNKAAGNDGSLREIISLAKERSIVVKEVPQKRLDELSMGAGYAGKPGNHQGVVAQVPSYKYSELEDIFAYAEKRCESPFIIVLDGVKDPENLGSIMRSAEALGAHGIIIPKRRGASLTSTVCKVASGAEEYIPVVKVTNISAALEELKKRGIWVAAADMSGVPAASVDLKGAICLVIGSEGEGVSRLVRENSDYVIRVPMRGAISSLNAASAAAILMYEKLRQDDAGNRGADA